MNTYRDFSYKNNGNKTYTLIFPVGFKTTVKCESNEEAEGIIDKIIEQTTSSGE